MTSLIFATVSLTASVGIVHLSGYVQTDDPAAAAPNPAVKPMLIGGAVLVAGLTFVGLSMAITHLGWAFAIVIAGSTFLLAPFLVEPLPTRIKDGALGLGIFIAIAAVALGFGITETWGN